MPLPPHPPPPPSTSTPSPSPPSPPPLSPPCHFPFRAQDTPLSPSTVEEAATDDNEGATGERGQANRADSDNGDFERDATDVGNRSVGGTQSSPTRAANVTVAATEAKAEGVTERLKKAGVPPMLLLRAVPEAVMCQLVLAGWERSSAEDNG